MEIIFVVLLGGHTAINPACKILQSMASSSFQHLSLVGNVRRDFLVLCDLALNKFVAQLPELYGREHVSYNVH